MHGDTEKKSRLVRRVLSAGALAKADGLDENGPVRRSAPREGGSAIPPSRLSIPNDLEFPARHAPRARRGQWRPPDFPPEPNKQSCKEVK